MYAVIKTGGKQYSVAIGDKLKIELMPITLNDNIVITDVLMIVDDANQVTVGSPNIDNASVQMRVINHGRHKKIRIFKMKRRKHYQKHQGHRQHYTEVEVLAINR